MKINAVFMKKEYDQISISFNYKKSLREASIYDWFSGNIPGQTCFRIPMIPTRSLEFRLIMK